MVWPSVPTISRITGGAQVARSLGFQSSAWHSPFCQMVACGQQHTERAPLRSTGSWVLHGASGAATTLMASWPAPPSWCRRLGPAYVMGGGVQAQLSSFAAAHTDGPGADCRENRLNSEQNSLKVPKIFACGAFFRLRRRVRKGLKHPPLITLTADRAYMNACAAVYVM